MPHVRIICRPGVTDLLDSSTLMTELNALVVDGSGSNGVSKSSLTPVEAYDDGKAPDGRLLIHVEIALLRGRSPAVKARLSEAVLELLATHVRKAGVQAVSLSVEVRDLPDSYHLSRGRAPVRLPPRRTAGNEPQPAPGPPGTAAPTRPVPASATPIQSMQA